MLGIEGIRTCDLTTRPSFLTLNEEEHSYITLVARSQTDPFYTQHLTCGRGTVFPPPPSVCLISPLHDTTLNHHPLIQDWLFT